MMEQEKAALRRSMRERRKGLSLKEQERAALAAYAHLAAFEPYRRAKSIMAYIACRGEMSLEPAIWAVLGSGKTLLLPRCEAPGVMTARRVSDWAQLHPGAHGLLEPGEDCEIFSPQEIDLVLAPGTAFDVRGGRLGQGGGYYDRFFTQTGAFLLGVCHGFALLDRVPMDAHDARMDGILTPEGIRLTDRNISDDGRT